MSHRIFCPIVLSDLLAEMGLPWKKFQSFKSVTAVIANYTAPMIELHMFGFACQKFFPCRRRDTC